MKIDIILEADVDTATTNKLGRLAEQYGINAVWTSNYAASRDPYMILTKLAETSQHITLGPLAVSPFEQHPLKMANQLMTLHEQSDGRAGIFVGGGGAAMTAMGVKAKKMVQSVRECVEILKQCCAGRFVRYQGEVYTVQNYIAPWAPKTPPKIYVGANQEKMVRMATELSDGLMMSDMPLQRIDDTIAIARDGLSQHGRDAHTFRLNNVWAWHVKESEEEAHAEARPELLLRGLLMRWWLTPFLSEEECDLVEEKKSSFFQSFRTRSWEIEGVPEEIITKLIEHLSFTGDMRSLDHHIERLRIFKNAGLTDFALRLHENPEDAIKVIGEKVIPALQ